MKKLIILIFLIIATSYSIKAQYTGTLVVQGDLDKFYPVVFADNREAHKAGELEIGRSNVHEDGDWRGSVIAKFTLHTTNWGNGASFIDADIKQFKWDYSSVPFIAGWADATSGNGISSIIVWLRGGDTHYHYYTNASAVPVVYDGTQNPLPYNEPNGTSHSYKVNVESYVNSYGPSNSGTAYYNGSGNSYYLGSLSIGTADAHGFKLAVNGNIRAKEIKVESTNWPDYVFTTSHSKLSLPEVETFIKANQHLPEIPSAKEVQNNGISLGEMNSKLLKKIEELTLYLIEKDKEIKELTQRVLVLEKVTD